MGRPIRSLQIQKQMQRSQHTPLELAIADLNTQLARLQNEVARVAAEAAAAVERAKSWQGGVDGRDPEYVSVHWVAKQTALSVDAIYRQIRSGEIEGAGTGRRRLVTWAGYMALVERLRADEVA